MKFILSAIVLFSYSTLFAQERIEINGKSRVNLDSLANTGQSTVKQSSKMPNALQGFKDNQQLKGNNQHGFDIYQSQVDNVSVLKPDANNAASFKSWNAYPNNTSISQTSGKLTVIPYEVLKLLRKPKDSSLNKLTLPRLSPNNH